MLANYLQDISLPTLSHSAHLALDAPLTVEELQKVACSFPMCKAPGDDGIPVAVYTTYGDTVLPRLLEVFNASVNLGYLPASMSRTNVVLLLKLGEDPLDPDSYRPISLLQSDVKILAKVLALRLN